MKRGQLSPKAILVAACLALAAGLAACDQTDGGPRAWIDYPRDGARLVAGTPVTVISHGYAPEGLAEMSLSVNGAAYRLDPPAKAGAAFSQVEQEWLPTEEGVYTLQVVAYDSAGEPSAPASVSITVVGQVALAPSPTSQPSTPPPPGDTPAATATASPTPTGTPRASDTPTPTGTPTASATPTATSSPTASLTPSPTATPTPTTTPWPPPQVSLTPEGQVSLVQGECLSLRWDVEYASAVYLNGEGVAGHDQRQVCPASTTTYLLHVEAPSGNVDKSLTIQVSAPADTVPPPVPSPAVPADGLALGCRKTQNLVWQPVRDPSGVAYYVKLEQQVQSGQWQSVRGWGPVTDKQVEAQVQCGVYYRWAVRAQDGAGNISDWSGWSAFSVVIN